MAVPDPEYMELLEIIKTAALTDQLAITKATSKRTQNPVHILLVASRQVEDNVLLPNNGEILFHPVAILSVNQSKIIDQIEVPLGFELTNP